MSHKKNTTIIMLLWLMWSLLLSSITMAADNELPVAKPGCPERCGEVTIPYPFGIGRGCYHDPKFEVVCNNSSSNYKPFLPSINIEIVDINTGYNQSGTHYLPKIAVIMPVQRTCGIQNASIRSSLDLGETPFWYSQENALLKVMSCGSSVYLRSRNGTLLGGCSALCDDDDESDQDYKAIRQCSGVGCCQIDLYDFGPLDLYRFDIVNFPMRRSRTCTSITMNQIRLVNISSSVTLLSWKIINPIGIDKPSPNETARYCENYTHNDPTKMKDSFYCYCEEGYFGNPYISNGCQVPNECEGCKTGYCRPNRYRIGLDGPCRSNYFYYEIRSNHYRCDYFRVPSEWILLKVAIIVGSFIGLILLCSGNIYVCFRKRKHMKEKEKFFKQNGGLLLKQQVALYEGSESTRIFKAVELNKATKSYSKDNILGKGGFGTVYKGILPNQQAVAIKKSMISSDNQVEQFINEVVILTQINHRNVVKLLGCCLGTQVPLLVYEFVSNGNLFEHIHEKNDSTWLFWENCLRVATEAANAIAYLHAAASIPIIHRDIKSSNILLDDNFTAKISDFGASRLVPIDQSQVTTLVQGTFGYLDPEYFQTSHLTEKSDVYSFAVVLLELLTRRKSLLWGSEVEGVNLATYFLISMKNNQLLDIVDPRFIEEATQEQLNTIAKLTEQCLSVKGQDRPTMKEVAKELEGLMKKNVKDLRHDQDSNNKQMDLNNCILPCRTGCEASRQYTMEQEIVLEMSSPR